MNEEMKQHVDALAMMLAEEGKNRKVLIDCTGGFLLSIDEQEFNLKSTGIALGSLIGQSNEGE